MLNTYRKLTKLVVLSSIFLLYIGQSCTDKTIEISSPPKVSDEYINFDNPYSKQRFLVHVDSEEEWEVEYDHESWIRVELKPYIDKYNIIINTVENTTGQERYMVVTILLSKNRNISTKIFVSQKASQGPNILDSIPDLRFKEIITKYIFKSEYATALDAKQIESINCEGLKIRSIKGIEYFTELLSFNCSFNFLDEVDLSNNKKIKNVNVSFNSLDTVDFRENVHLENLDVSLNSINNLDLGGNIYLKNLSCYSNNISRLDLSKNVNMLSLDCSFNPLEEKSVLVPELLYLNKSLIPSFESGIYFFKKTSE